MWTSIWYSYVYLHETSKIIKRQTQIESKVGKEIIHSGFANHFSNEESVGGKLYLLVDKLQFQPHRLNLQNYELIITIEEIQQIRFFRTLGLIPNRLKIITIGGQVEKFVVNSRKHWQKEILELKNRAQHAL